MRKKGSNSRLSEYRAKRDFTRTAEPQGDSKVAADRIFVVQKHDASRLHYDLRLQIGGVLASWAVPKGPSLNPADKRLAVRVEDHPVGYATFEGTIPKGQYGGGTVIVWDRGTWQPKVPDPGQAIEQGRLAFTLTGERLRGSWTLTRMGTNGEKAAGKEQWLLIKSKDDAARETGSITDELITSVVTGQDLAEVAKDGKPRRPSRVKPVAPAVRDQGSSRAEPPFGFQLCTLSESAPTSGKWLHELKFDGYRLLAVREGKSVQLWTRGGLDWAAKFQPIVAALQELDSDHAVIDGEAVVLDKDGRSSFQGLQKAMKAKRFKRLAFFAFDLLMLNGSDLRQAPLTERKSLLRELVPEDSLLRFSDHVSGSGEPVLGEACRLGLEGIIAKRADAPYVAGRSRTWLKVKCDNRQEFVVIGWSDPSGSRAHLGSLLLGVYKPSGGLVYTGRVGTGFDADDLREIKKRLSPLARKTCPADSPPNAAERRGAHWVRPEMVVEVRFGQWTDDGRLRHPSFIGVREDKDPLLVVREEAGPAHSKGTPMGKTKSSAARVEEPKPRSAIRSGVIHVAGVAISHPERVVFADTGLTKKDIADYYAAVADSILPYLGSRPLSVLRCPEGTEESCFYQKHAGQGFRDPVKAIQVPEKDGHVAYLAVDSVEGLVSLAQYGVIEIHPWGSTEVNLEHPDMLTFDLDPGPGVDWREVCRAASHVRDVLGELGLSGYLKSSGGKGLHVVVPVKPDTTWATSKSFCASFAKSLAKAEPSRFVAVASKASRQGRIFIDYLRNSRGATSIAPYSVRARTGAPVAVPLRWEELGKLKSSDQYSMTSVLRRLARLKSDPWEDFTQSAVSLRSLAGGAVA